MQKNTVAVYIFFKNQDPLVKTTTSRARYVEKFCLTVLQQSFALQNAQTFVSAPFGRLTVI